VTRRQLAASVAVALVAVAGCGSPATTSTGGSTPTVTPPLAPWIGSFTTDTLPPTVQALRAVTCPTAKRCWAVGSTQGTGSTPSTATVATTVDGGSSWIVQPIPATIGFLSAIACSGPRACTAVGQIGSDGTGPGAVVSTLNAGATWTLEPVPAGTTDVTAVECGATGGCMALASIGGRVTALSSAGVGAPWVAGGALPSTVSAATGISCTNATLCWATGVSPDGLGHVSGVIVGTPDGGATWALEPVPPGLGALEDVACTPTVPPVIPGISGAPGSSGTSGTPGRLDAPSATPVTVPPSSTTSSTTSSSAPSSSVPSSSVPATSTTVPGSDVDCTAVGTTSTVVGAGRTGQAVVLTTSDGGLTWAPAPVTSTGADLLSVSCDAGPCAAVGSTVASTPGAGLVVLTGPAGNSPTGWRKAVVATVGLPLTGVDCRSLSTCVAVGESISAHLTTG
jgi:hypothetical protein